MRKISTLATGLGGLLGFLLLVAALAVPGGTTQGAALQVTPSVTVDPGRGTRDAGPATPTRGTTTRGTATAAGTAAAPTPTRTPTPTPRRGAVTVSPSSVAAGTPLTVTGSGFSANALLTIAIEEEATGATAAYVQPGVDAGGSFSQRFDTADFRPGRHTVTVFALPNVDALAQATFTVAGTPSMPNTGAGAAPARDTRAPWLIAGATIVALAGLGALAWRRRAA